MNLLILAAVGAALWLTSRTSTAHASAPSGVVVMVHAGVPYRFVVRLYTVDRRTNASASAMHAALTAAGATDIEFSNSRCAFRIVPKKSDTTTVGTPLTGFGVIESITRLDGKPFTAPA